MLACAEISQHRLAPQELASQKIPIKMINTVLNEDTGELMEYRSLMKDPKYQNLYAQLYAKELIKLAQGLHRKVAGTNTIFSPGKQMCCRTDDAMSPMGEW